MTIITDENIHNLVTTYLENPAELPEDLHNISAWDVSRVTNMSRLFYGASSFNQSLNNWNVKNVRNMEWMFAYAKRFNQPLNNWNVSNVTNMSDMFDGASSFNQPLNNWNVRKVTDMRRMFYGASSFNQPLNNWNVRKVTDMNHMFLCAKKFDNRNRPGELRQSVRPQCISQAEYAECRDTNGKVTDTIMLEEISRRDSVKLPGENTQCYSRESLRNVVRTANEQGVVPLSPYTRREITKEWIENNLGEGACEEAATCTLSGGKKKKTRKRKGKTSKKKKKTRKRKSKTRKRKGKTSKKK